MKRLFVTVAILVVVLNVGFKVYSEIRTRRTIAKVTSRKTEIEKQQNIALVSDFSNATVDIPQAKSDMVYVPIPEDERGEDYMELESSEAPLKELDEMIADLEPV